MSVTVFSPPTTEAPAIPALEKELAEIFQVGANHITSAHLNAEIDIYINSTNVPYKVSVHDKKHNRIHHHEMALGEYAPAKAAVSVLPITDSSCVFRIEDHYWVVTFLERGWVPAVVPDFKFNGSSLFSKVSDFHSAAKKSERPATPLVPNTRGLSLVRKQTDSMDFTINCDDGESIKVHSLVLRSVWPYFDNLMNSGMTEASKMSLALPHSSKSVMLLVDYCYGDLEVLEFDEAAEVLFLGNMYGLPDLEKCAEIRILRTPLDVGTCLLGWRRGYDTNNAAIREYCAKYYLSKLATFSQSTGFNEMAKDELAQLVLDASLQSSKEKTT